MRKRLSGLIYACMIFLFFGFFAYGKEYKVVMPELPEQVIKPYKDLINAFSEVSDNTFTVEVVPFARCIYMIESKQADYMIPILEIPDVKKHKDLKFDYSTIDVIDLAIVLYSNKTKTIDINELKKGNPKNFYIETDLGHLEHFPFKCNASSDIAGSLKKVDSGRIDGYILGQAAVDAVLKNLGLKNIKRQYYDTFKIKFMIQKGQRGGEADKLLTDIITKLKKSGRFQKIMDFSIKISEKYNDWQP